MPRRSLLLVFVLLVLAACTPARGTFTAAFERAVKARDAQAVWALLDRATREKVLAGLRRSREKAAQDAEFRALRAAALSPVPPDGGDEALAVALLREQLAARDPLLSDDGTNPRVHLEDGAWKITAEPVGFTSSDGAALTLWLRVAEPPRRPRDEVITSLRLNAVELGSGKTDPEMLTEYASRLRRVVEIMGLPDSYAAPASRIVHAYHERLLGNEKHNHVAFDVGKTGSLTAVYAKALLGFGGSETLVDTKKEATLEFGVWR